MKFILLFAALLALLSFLSCLARYTLPQQISNSIESAVHEQIIWRQNSPKRVQSEITAIGPLHPPMHQLPTVRHMPQSCFGDLPCSLHLGAGRFSRDDHEGDAPVYLRLRLLNVTNLQEVKQGGRPQLAELGPYTFAKHRVKRHVWFDSEGAVRFHEYTYHLPLPSLTNGSLDDKVTTLNIPLLGALEVIESLSPAAASRWLQILASLVESWGDPSVSGLFTTRTVGELLWGYTDPLLSRLSPFVSGLDPTFRLVRNMSFPREADGANCSMQVDTGLFDLSQVWQYQRWQGVSEVTSWNPPHREPVRGTDAMQFRPWLRLNDSVEAWVGELYRSARLVAEERVQLERVPLLRFRPDPQQGEPDERYFQYIRGLMNITSPTAAGPSGQAGRPGPPLFLSFPHFCRADPLLVRGVEGLACDPSRHELFLDVEPTTGITLRAAKRLMLSSRYGPKWAAIEPGLRDTFLPIFWAEEASEATAKQLAQFQPMLSAQRAQHALEAFGLSAAAALASLAVLCVLLDMIRNTSRQRIAAAAAAESTEWVGGEDGNNRRDAGGRRVDRGGFSSIEEGRGGDEISKPLLDNTDLLKHEKQSSTT